MVWVWAAEVSCGNSSYFRKIFEEKSLPTMGERVAAARGLSERQRRQSTARRLQQVAEARRARNCRLGTAGEQTDSRLWQSDLELEQKGGKESEGSRPGTDE
jgi:CRISPR/Cas system Type II protein with McrA/HNH and RuvC-like nuclease domain